VHTRQVEKDGSVRIASEQCSFVYRRVRPGVLLVSISGFDSGEFAMESIDQVRAMIARSEPTELFVDLSGVTGVTPNVSDAWAAWFRANRQSVRRVSILATSRFMSTMASMVKLLSGTDKLIRVYTEAAPFEQALAPAAKAPARSAAPAHVAAAVSAAQRPTVRREVYKDGAVRLSCPTCAFVYRRLRPGVLLVSISGSDKGDLGTAPVDEVSAEIERFGPIDLFVDTRGAVGVAREASDLWTAWFRDNQQRLEQVSILATSRFVHLVVSVAKLFSRTGDLIRIYDEAESFEEAIAREAPGSTRPQRPG